MTQNLGEVDELKIAYQGLDEELVRAAMRLTHLDDPRRRFARTPLTIPVTVVPCDCNGVTQGKPVTVVSCEISAGGIGLLHNAPLKGFFIVEIERERVTFAALAEIVRCGEVNGLYRIGARLLKKMTPSASSNDRAGT